MMRILLQCVSKGQRVCVLHYITNCDRPLSCLEYILFPVDVFGAPRYAYTAGSSLL